MKNIIEVVTGSIKEKKEWFALEKRSHRLPKEYQVVYEEIKKYLWKSSGVMSMSPFVTLVDLFEDSAANKLSVLDVIGSDVAAFCDDLIKGESSYFDTYRTKLNKDIADKIK